MTLMSSKQLGVRSEAQKEIQNVKLSVVTKPGS